MHLHRLPGQYNQTVTIDACQACGVLWFDKGESGQLEPDGVVELFQIVNAKGGAQSPQLGPRLGCVRCNVKLTPSQDKVVTGQFNYFSCKAEHGRLISFYQFLIEKRFVRNLTLAERRKLAVEVKQIKCSGCGAPVNLGTESACSYCRSPVAVFDRDAAKKAIAHYLASRGKQLPARPDLILNSPALGHSNHFESHLGYRSAELAVDALWAIAQFARFSGRSPSRAISDNTSSGVAQSMFSANVPTADEAFSSTNMVELTESGSSIFEGVTGSSSDLIDLVGDGIGSLLGSLFD
jgi:hypothetical protein